MRYFVEKPLVLVGALTLSALVLGVWMVIRFGSVISVIGAIIVMIVAGALSRLPQRFSGGDIGVELLMVFTISSALVFGLRYGVIVGAVGMLLSARFTAERPDDVGIAILGFAVVSGLAAFFGNWSSILVMGLAYTFFYDLLVCSLYLFTGHNPVGCIRFSATHLLWNYIVFKNLGPWLIAFLSNL